MPIDWEPLRPILHYHQRFVLSSHVRPDADAIGSELALAAILERLGKSVRMAEALDLPLPPESVMPLFCALATDTGWFRFSSTTGDTLRLAARLIDLGAQPDLIYQSLYEQYSYARVKLAGHILDRVTLDVGGRLAYTWVHLADFEETGAKPVDTEDMVNECLRIAGTECAFIAIEQQNKRIKFSFRSRTKLNVAEVAEQ